MPARASRPRATAVSLESGARRVFASALDWPGWCRSGRDEGSALEALAAAGPRYAGVAAEAGVTFPDEHVFEVVERLDGSATTDFGAPGAIGERDREQMAAAVAERRAALVTACWDVFDRVVAAAPAELRKGPRGGGRDRDAIVEHVLVAELAYARKIGLRLPQPAPGDRAAIGANRREVAGALRSAAGGEAVPARGWPARYAARRIAWHVLDHAWEIEDRGRPAPPS